SKMVENLDNMNEDVDNLAEKISELGTREVVKHTSLQETKHEVEVKLVDEDEPLLSVATFEQLNFADLLKGVYEMGFSNPSKIQAKALPLLLKDPPQNMIGQSQSGTGKTAAFVLTMLSRIDPGLKEPQALCLTPSRELARQIMTEVRKMGKYTSVVTAEAIRESQPRVTKTRLGEFHGVQLIVGTPGTVYDLLKRQIIEKNFFKIFVLDEADNMLDQQGLGDQSIRIKNIMPKNCQIVLFSATYPLEVRNFASRFAPNANEFSLKVEELSVRSIKQFYVDCTDEDHKIIVLDELYSLLTISQTRLMTERNRRVINLHAGLSTIERDQVMDGFRSGSAKVLITTNVLARGIDVLQVNLVINYDLPVDYSGRNPDYETYLHRIGRTGRFGRSGVSINFVHDLTSWELVKRIEEHFKRDIIKLPTDNWPEVEEIVKKYVS
ncbi:6018_t:CDS:2, partial [Entrophospora sp. SA101]